VRADCAEIAQKADDAHVCTALSRSVGYEAVLVTGTRDDKNVSHHAVRYAFLVSNYVALFVGLTMSVVA